MLLYIYDLQAISTGMARSSSIVGFKNMLEEFYYNQEKDLFIITSS